MNPKFYPTEFGGIKKKQQIMDWKQPDKKPKTFAPIIAHTNYGFVRGYLDTNGFFTPSNTTSLKHHSRLKKAEAEGKLKLLKWRYKYKMSETIP